MIDFIGFYMKNGKRICSETSSRAHLGDRVGYSISVNRSFMIIDGLRNFIINLNGIFEMRVQGFLVCSTLRYLQGRKDWSHLCAVALVVPDG